MAYTLQEDPAVALQAAATLYASRFDKIACASGESETLIRVIEAAEVFKDWLRRPVRLELELIRIEEQETGEPVADPPNAGGNVTTIDTSQQVRYALTAKDDRGFPVDATLNVKVEPAGTVDAEILEAATGTASGKDELLVKANATGPTSALVTVFDPANETTIFGSDAVDVVAGGVATVVLESPIIEEQPPAPEPEPEPVP